MSEPMAKRMKADMSKQTDVDSGLAKPRRTEDKAVRKAQLIDATIDCISKYGLSGTTLAKVTEVAGLSLGLVSFHFDSKEKLLEETLRFVAEEHRDNWLTAVNSKATSDRDRFYAIYDSFFDPKICNHKKLSVWFAFFGEFGPRKAYRRIVEDIDDERYEESMRLLTSMMADRDDIDLDVSSVCLTLEALMDGLWLCMLIYPRTFTRAETKARARRVIDLMILGVSDNVLPQTGSKS
jgi:TetR/AcrR family transcriptional regulator, transcriptional repressor of bet genes